MSAGSKLKQLFKPSKAPSRSYKRVCFLTSLPKAHLEEILLFSESDALFPLLPSLKKRKTLWLNDQKHKYLFKKVLAQDPADLTNYVYSTQGVNTQNPSMFSVMGDVDRLCFKPNQFDLVIAPLSLISDRVDENQIKALSRVLKNGGRLVLAIRHPFLDQILFNQNPASQHVASVSMQSVFEALKKADCFFEEMSEGVVNRELKPFFTVDGELTPYHEFKTTPLTLAIRAVKYKK